MKLRSKILSYTLPLILIPSLLMAAAVYYFLIQVNQTEIEETRKQELNEVLVDFGRENNVVRKDVRLLSSVPAISDYLIKIQDGRSDHEEIQAKSVLELFFQQNPYYLEVTLLDKFGKELLKFSKLPNAQELGNRKGESYFLRTLISGNVQTPVIEVQPNRYATLFTSRVSKEDEFLGMIVIALNTEIFERSMRPLLRQNIEMFLFDDRGVILASISNRNENKWIKSLDLKGEAAELFSDPFREDTHLEVDRGNEKYFVSFLPSESLPQIGSSARQDGTNWFLMVVEPKADRAVPFTFRVVFFSILALALAGVLLAASEAARRITIPLEKVSAATAQIARGDSTIDLEVNTGDEVEDLARAIGEMSSELQAYQKQIVQTAKLAVMGEMTSEISHEIQNRISGISLWLQHLDSEIDESDPKREYVEEMKMGLDGFMEMLRDLKKYYKKPILSLAEAEPDSIVEEAFYSAREKFKRKGIVVDKNIPENLPKIICDKAKLVGVILNLLVNAADTVDENGEVSVSIEEDPAKLELSFKVRDNGEGIDAENLSRIYFPFYSTKPGGSGLGLSISSNIIAAHKGRIEVSSEVGSGTTFKITVPINQGL